MLENGSNGIKTEKLKDIINKFENNTYIYSMDIFEDEINIDYYDYNEKDPINRDKSKTILMS